MKNFLSIILQQKDLELEFHQFILVNILEEKLKKII